MAEYGLRVKNANGFVQIDGTYANLALVEKLTLSASTQGGGPNNVIWSVTRDFTGYTNPAIALSPPSNVSVCWSGQLVGSTLRVTFWATSAVSFEVYVFDVASRGQKFNINYGLIVKNKTTGAVVFDSRMKYMRVLESISGSSNNGGFATINRAYAGALKVAVVQSVFWAWSSHEIVPDDPVNPTAVGVITASMVTKPSANSIRIAAGGVYSNSSRLSTNPVPNTYSPGFSYIALDVSNYD